MPGNYFIARPRQSRRRKCQSLSTKMRSIARINEEVFEQHNIMSISVNNLRKARLRLRQCIDEVVKRESKMRSTIKVFQEATEELREAAEDIKELYTFEEKDQTILNLHTTLALEDTFIARRQLKRLEDELDHMSPIVKESSNDTESPARCYDQVTITEPTVNRMSHFPVKAKPVHTCSICMEKEANCVIVDCGHVCMCHECFCGLAQHAETNACPICRSKIKDIIVPVPL